ncbi:hypothetical protein BH09BAC2_BH09BAC2_10910 [soil metagenome]
MKALHRFYWSAFLLLLMHNAFAQPKPANLSNLRKKVISTTVSIIQFDSVSVVPNTFTIQDVPADLYDLDIINATLKWKLKPAADSVYISYRVFRTRLNEVSRRYNYDSIRYHFTLEPEVLSGNTLGENKLFDFGNMNYSGSIGRGISFGNNQDAVVNSSLNLQLNGFIGDSLELTAAISDNNIPIQPDGTTQDVRDFDKIFIQVKKKNWKLNFGDIDIRQNSNYFLNFYKRLQGGSFQTDNHIGRNIQNSLLVSGAIAKGKFTKNIIVPIEGNQGPYRLKSPNGELYFAVLATTERVFIDGELLERGDDRDYVIDYNAAEIRFTPRRLITKDSRIQVEFEYADRSYLNSQLYANDEIGINKKLMFSISAFSNTDAKNSPINQSLDEQQKLFLASIGNSIDQAVIPNAVRDTFAANKILYKKIDMLYNNIHDSIFVYSFDKNDILYNVSFLFVGSGKGNYVVQPGAANGKVFKWVQPLLNGSRQGDYQPAILLVTPKKHQLISAAAAYALNERTSIKTEMAVSNYDVNTFSSKDKNQNKGFAGRVLIANKSKVFRSAKNSLTLFTNAGYEYVQDRFRPIERLRNIEFNRDWSLAPDAPSATENLLNASLELKAVNQNSLKYEFVNYNRSDSFTGIKQKIFNFLQYKGWKLTDQITLTHISSFYQQGAFIRPTIDLVKQFPSLKNIQLGATFSAEDNRILNKNTDTLTPLSFSFTSRQIYLRSSANDLNKWGLTYSTRTNKFPVKDQLITSDKSDNINIFTELLKNEHHQFKINATYRTLRVINTSVTNQKPDETFLGRLEYAVNKWRGLLTGGMLYEVGSGQEQKREYTYVEVPAGQGEYFWIDYNNNGIPEQNEFEIAVYPDQRKYVKVFTPTNQFVKANYVQFNYNVDISPRSLISSDAKGFKNIIRRTSTSSALQINKRDLYTGAVQFNPFKNNLVDTSLIALNSFLSNTLFFNRTSVKWGFDVTHRLTNAKVLLAYGVESRRIRDLSLRSRWNITHSFLVSATAKSARNQLNTPKFANRNYNIAQTSVEPSLSYIHGSNLRVTLLYNFDKRINEAGAERALNNALSSEVKYNLVSNGTITGKVTYNNIDFTGSANSTIGYTLLDGLLPGKNFLWEASLIRRLAGNIEMEMRYEGRKPGTAKSIHTGTATLRAIF